MPMIQDFRLLRHMLGANDSSTKSARAKWGERNFLAVREGTPEFESMQRLEAAGFVKQGAPEQGTDAIFFRATLKGCQWIGLTPKQIDKALEKVT